MWRVADGIVIPDYKTAKFTANADKLLPIYETQLNGYAKIAEHLGEWGKVAAIPLIYFEPKTDDIYVIHNSTQSSHFDMTFIPKVLDLELDIPSIDVLLEKARNLYDGPIPAPTPKCKDCEKVMKLAGLVG
jgi:hypothetical protein